MNPWIRNFLLLAISSHDSRVCAHKAWKWACPKLMSVVCGHCNSRSYSDIWPIHGFWVKWKDLVVHLVENNICIPGRKHGNTDENSQFLTIWEKKGKKCASYKVSHMNLITVYNCGFFLFHEFMGKLCHLNTHRNSTPPNGHFLSFWLSREHLRNGSSTERKTTPKLEAYFRSIFYKYFKALKICIRKLVRFFWPSIAWNDTVPPAQNIAKKQGSSRFSQKKEENNHGIIEGVRVVLRGSLDRLEFSSCSNSLQAQRTPRRSNPPFSWRFSCFFFSSFTSLSLLVQEKMSWKVSFLLSSVNHPVSMYHCLNFLVRGACNDKRKPKR